MFVILWVSNTLFSILQLSYKSFLTKISNSEFSKLFSHNGRKLLHTQHISVQKIMRLFKKWNLKIKIYTQLTHEIFWSFWYCYHFFKLLNLILSSIVSEKKLFDFESFQLKLSFYWFCLIWIFCDSQSSCLPVSWIALRPVSNAMTPGLLDPLFWARSCGERESAPIPVVLPFRPAPTVMTWRETHSLCVCVCGERERERKSFRASL